MTPASKRPLALVTGARGFIGSVVSSRLEDAGFVVRLGVRRPDPAMASQIACDLDLADQVRAAVAGVDLVIHAAYGDSNAMEAQARCLLDAMGTAGVANLIHFSSIAVYGDATGKVDETTPLREPPDGYACAKIACEGFVRAWAGETAREPRRAVVLRPGIVYGKGSPFWVDKLGARIRLGAWGTFGSSGAGDAALVHVADVAELVATIACTLSGDMRDALPPVATMNVVGPETPAWNQYFTALAATMGAPALPVLERTTISMRQKLAIGAKIWRKLGLAGGERLALAPTAGELALFARKADYRTSAMRDLVGFTPKVSLAEGLARTFAQTKA